MSEYIVITSRPTENLTKTYLLNFIEQLEICIQQLNVYRFVQANEFHKTNNCRQKKKHCKRTIHSISIRLVLRKRKGKIRKFYENILELSPSIRSQLPIFPILIFIRFQISCIFEVDFHLQSRPCSFFVVFRLLSVQIFNLIRNFTCILFELIKLI